MQVATPALKQQNKPPTSMRYKRVEDIIQDDLRLKRYLGPKNQVVDSRFGASMMFAKEVVEVTQAIHAEGKDAHKVPKHEVLRVAMRIMKIGNPSNGHEKLTAPLIPITLPEPVAPTVQTKQQEIPKKTPTQKKAQSRPTQPKATPSKKKTKATPAPVAKRETPKKSVKAARPVPIKNSKPRNVVEKPAQVEEPEEEPTMPESELPPEKQPLRLPAKYDPTKHPHYDVQSSIYSLILTAMTCAIHFEKKPGYEERQKKLDDALQAYLESCNQLKLP